MKIYVTGGFGMVGRSLVSVGKAHGHDMICNTREQLNLNNYEDLVSFLKDCQPDLVIHSAGKVGGIKANIASPLDFFQENLFLGSNVIRACLSLGIDKLVNLGSSCIYPRAAKNPFTEDQLLTGKLEPTNEGYALAKLSIAKFCEYASQQKKVSYKTVIPCNLYGPWDKFDSNNAHLVPAVISKLHQAKLNNKEIIDIWGSGNARREFMYVDDLSSFIFHGLDKLNEWDAYINVGLGVDYSINDYYYAIADVVGYKGSFEHDLNRPEGMMQKLVCTKKQKSMGWEPNISLEEGLEKTYEFYLSKY